MTHDQEAALFLMLAIPAILGGMVFVWAYSQRCKHKWEIIQRTSFYEQGHSRPSEFVITLQCVTCGDIKKKRGA